LLDATVVEEGGERRSEADAPLRVRRKALGRQERRGGYLFDRDDRLKMQQ